MSWNGQSVCSVPLPPPLTRENVMAFGTWYDDQEEAYLVDNSGRKLSHIDATAKVREILNKRLNDGDMTRDELVTQLVDRMDVADLMGFVADADQEFLPEVLPQQQGGQ